MIRVLLLSIGLFFGATANSSEVLQNNIGIAQNSHYIAFIEGGYYIEEEGLINENDVVYVSDEGDIYIIDNIEDLKEGK